MKWRGDGPSPHQSCHLHGLAPRANRPWNRDLAPAPDFHARVRGDPIRLRQVVVNLAGNAIKFTETGQVVIQLRALERVATALTARIDVVDTGIGITPDARARIFESFVQADGSATRRYGGAGLGLAISRRLGQLTAGRRFRRPPHTPTSRCRRR